MSPTDPALMRPSKTAELAAAIRALPLRRTSPPLFADDLAFRTQRSRGVPR